MTDLSCSWRFTSIKGKCIATMLFVALVWLVLAPGAFAVPASSTEDVSAAVVQSDQKATDNIQVQAQAKTQTQTQADTALKAQAGEGSASGDEAAGDKAASDDKSADDKSADDKAAEGEVPVVGAPAAADGKDAGKEQAGEPELPYEDTHVNMYRLYNPNSGEHFYTGELVEAQSVASAGWRWEGIGWVAPIENALPVFRLYNPNAGDHHYTMEEAERDNLKKEGWNYEGIGWYSDSEDQLAVLRQYNPNAVAGAHNFTTDASEDAHLGENGWNREGTAWFATNGERLAIEGFWLVTDAWGTLERYWVASDAAVATSRLVPAAEAGWDAYATDTGAVVRGKHDRGDGYVYVADNDGRLAATPDGSDGWLVTDAYDGGMQRYFYASSERAMRSGFFEVDGARYFGVAGQGYVLRGRAAWGDHVLLADDDGRMATGTGWLVTAAYDGDMQRYWLDDVWSGYSGARTGMFDIDGKKYYGTPDTGRIARNTRLHIGDKWYQADNDGVLEEIRAISGDAELDNYLFATLDECGYDLWNCYNWVRDNTRRYNYDRDSYHDNYHNYGRYISEEDSIFEANYLFRNRGGDCYNSAAAMAWLARGCGYTASARAGHVPSARGGDAPHGWTEVSTDDGLRIIDVNMSLLAGLTDYNWYMISYDSAPVYYID